MNECHHDDCEFPAQFRARVLTTGPITGEKRQHESGNLCQYHMNAAVEQFKGNQIATVKVESI